MNQYRCFPVLLLSVIVVCGECRGDQPDIILMMADDLGFSDIGCYGSEIETPNLDALARSGQPFSNFSNTSRCCPSRASLLTGLYAHQAGLGAMTYKVKGPGYQGQLRSDVATLPERLRGLGYATAMVGKWHQTLSRTIDDGPNGSWPLQRGFDRFYGSMEGAKNYFRPKWFFDGTDEVTAFSEEFYYTDAISSRAANWVRGQPKNKPLFLYTAFYAPHFPLQAPREVIDKYLTTYQQGWGKLRRKRFENQLRAECISPDAQLSPLPDDVPAWDTLPQGRRDELSLRMATYAAQVELLDRGVGRILQALKQAGRDQNALVIFLSDNGAASSGGVFGSGSVEDIGKPSAAVHTTYGKGWATVSNTPYRMQKANTHEGGVMAPLILRWPERKVPRGNFREDVAHIIDIAPTCLAAAGGDLNSVESPFEGIDLFSAPPHDRGALFYEHEKSKAVRLGDWKLVNRDKTAQWELYNLRNDRTEQHDLAEANPDRVQMLSRLWRDWATRCNVR